MSPDSLDRAFAALADPTRRAIIARLASSEATVNELAEPFDMTQPSISKHLKVLERAGLISRGRAAQTRPCRLEAAPLKEIANWVGVYRNLWEQMRFCNQPSQPQRKEREMAASHEKTTRNSAFQITRVFKAPRDRVWKAWSEADQLKHWWGPNGCSIDTHRFEFRSGGFLHYAMKFADAPTMWGRFNYREIVAPERIVWLNSFSNEKCGIARAPFSEFCPLEIENSVTFTERAGTTTVSLRAEPFGEVAEERKYFEELCSSLSLEQGYGGTFEQLANYLAKA
jgi:uncharacterized protein YndB with AHSA1/START domain/DNA-binding transcriptional ArsR family regulator